VAGGLTYSGVTPGSEHTCGVTTGGLAYCWGWRYYGALGDGSPLGDVSPPRLTPIAVVGGLSFSRLNTGGAHTCGVTTASSAYCWGANNAGQLGDDTQSNSSGPVAVVGSN
jgi:alpha-tubulin suppressor-like RCC1 family protein